MKWSYFVYILTNRTHTVLYTGVTNSLKRRLYEHKTKFNLGFTSKYNVNQLVYYEEHDSVEYAIMREKQVKRWWRQWKVEMINEFNPDWRDLSEDW